MIVIKRDTKEDYLKQILKESRASVKDFKYLKNSFQDSANQVKPFRNMKRIKEFKAVFSGVTGVFGSPEHALDFAKACSEQLRIKVAILDGDIIAPQFDFYRNFNPKFKNHSSHLSDEDATSLNLMIYEYNAKGHLSPMIESHGIPLSRNLILYSGNYNPINSKYYCNAPLSDIFNQLSNHYDYLVISFSKEYLFNPLVKNVLDISKFNLFFLSNNHSEARYVKNFVTVQKTVLSVTELNNIGVVELGKLSEIATYQGLYDMPVVKLKPGRNGLKSLIWSIVWELV